MTMTNPAATTTTAEQFDQLTARIDDIRRDLNTIVRRLPDTALAAVWDLAVAADALRQAAVALDKAADKLDVDQTQATAAAADDACQPIAYTLTDRIDA